MNSKKQCFKCSDYCTDCQFDGNDQLKCTACYKSFEYYNYGYYIYGTYYALNAESQCEKCPSLCRGCFWKQSISGFGCSDCYYGYALKDDQCLSCPTIPQLGEGCESCLMMHPRTNLDVMNA